MCSTKYQRIKLAVKQIDSFDCNDPKMLSGLIAAEKDDPRIRDDFEAYVA